MSEPAPGTLPPLPDEAAIAAIEEAAYELASLAGQHITDTLEHEIVVEYKDEAERGRAPSNPVSEVDHAVEQMLRERVEARFPGHCILGEEFESHPDPDDEYVWVVDPVDGTTNFVNGFPLFASAIGVLHRGRPIVGATWCSTSHELRAGVYHARLGGPLRFEGRPVPAGRPSRGVSRFLGAAPAGAPGRFRFWDTRTTGSAAIECAFVAAGIFQSAVFPGLRIWDVAGGVCLVRSAGLTTLTRDASGWHAFERFEPPATVEEERAPSLRDWRQFLILGTEEAAEATREFAARRRSRWGMRLYNMVRRFFG